MENCGPWDGGRSGAVFGGKKYRLPEVGRLAFSGGGSIIRSGRDCPSDRGAETYPAEKELNVYET